MKKLTNFLSYLDITDELKSFDLPIKDKVVMFPISELSFSGLFSRRYKRCDYVSLKHSKSLSIFKDRLEIKHYKEDHLGIILYNECSVGFFVLYNDIFSDLNILEQLSNEREPIIFNKIKQAIYSSLFKVIKK